LGQGIRAQIEADGYLAKPFELDDLIDIVGRYTAPSQTSTRSVH
jgi:hypothetical protein